METIHEKETRICKEFIQESVETLKKGGTSYVSSGYIQRDSEKTILDRNARVIVDKLHSLGFTSTTNHGHGCYDWRFTKKIEL